MKKRKLTSADIWAMFAETDKQMKALQKETGGISKSNGEFAEEFFYNSLKKSKHFAGIEFAEICKNFNKCKKMPDKTELQAQFDIVMINGDAVAIIEVKYKAENDFPKEMIEEKVPKFRALYPEYASYKLYLGLASMVLKDRVVQEAKKFGIGLLRQSGDLVEQNTEWVRVY